MKVAFLNHGFLVQQECLSALHRRSDISLSVIDTSPFASEQEAQKTCQVLGERAINLLITINDWGLDLAGQIANYAAVHGIVMVNWCTDDPFFIEIMLDVAIKPFPNRVDFVSDRSYVGPLRKRGCHAHFLPLAADPTLFAPANPPPDTLRDCAFVGNSYFEDLFGKYAKGHETFIEQAISVLAVQAGNLLNNVHHDIDTALAAFLDRSSVFPSLSRAKALFLLRHTVSYLFRKELVTSLASRDKQFMVFGDAYWVSFLPQEQVSMAVAYYDNLCTTYQQTRVNIDINRVVIREGFTQRVMDCLACGSFVLTSDKGITTEFFQAGAPDGHLDVFTSRADLFDKVAYYLRNAEERQAMARRGREVILAYHTYDHRIDTILRSAAVLLGRKPGQKA